MPFYSNIYRVNWNKLAILLLPTHIRKVKIVHYLLVLMTPIKTIYYKFRTFRDLKLYDLTINGQVILLEKVLNDTFDSALRRIYITDGNTYMPPLFLEEYKNRPVIFKEEGDADNPTFWAIDNLDDIISFNFFVHVPNELYYEASRMRALVNRYKAFGRTFNIVII